MSRKALAQSASALTALGLTLVFANHALMGSSETIEAFRYEHVVMEVQSLDQPISFYLERLQNNPSGALDRVSLAGLYLKKSRQTGDLSFVDQAETLAKKSIELLPEPNPGAKLVLAEVEEARHRFPEALKIASKVLEANPGSDGALSLLVTCSLGYGDLAAADHHSERALIRFPGSSEAHVFRGLVLGAQGRLDEATRSFVNAFDREELGAVESAAQSRALLARLYLDTGEDDRLEGARALIEESLRIYPSFHLALAQKARLEERTGNEERAIELYQKAFESLGEPPYLMDLANLHEKRGDAEKADALRSEAEGMIRQEMSSGPYGHHNELARVLLERNGGAARVEALREAKTEVEIRPTAESYFLLARAEALNENWESAKAAIEKVLATGARNEQYSRLSQTIERQSPA